MPEQPEPLAPRALNQRSVSSVAVRIVPYSPPRAGEPKDWGGQQPTSSPLSSSSCNPTEVTSHSCAEDAGRDGALPASAPESSRSSSDGIAEPSSSLLTSKSEAPGLTIRATHVRQSCPRRAPDQAGIISEFHAPCHHAPEASLALQQQRNTCRRSRTPTTTTTTPAAASSTLPRRPPPRRNLVTVHHPNSKTFSLQPHSPFTSQASSSIAPSLSLSASSSLGRNSSNIFSESEGRPSSPPTTLGESSLPPCTPRSSTGYGEDSYTPASSPWNYRLVGGLRKVPDTRDTRTEPARPRSTSSSSLPATSHLPALDDVPPPSDAEDSPSRILTNKVSFQSSQSSASTTSEATNYKVYGTSSPASPNPVHDTDSLPPPSSSDSNYEILGRSSPPTVPTPERGATDPSGLLHASAFTPPDLQLVASYSQESLIVPPLKPTKRKLSYEAFGLHKPRSTESLSSLPLRLTFSDPLGQEAIRSFLSTPVFQQQQQQHQHPGSALRRQTSDSRGFYTREPAPVAPLAKSHMQAHPHQWSSQLSTVISESEDGSDLASRSVSPLSVPGRRGSGFRSNHSRLVLSISSSLAAREETSSGSRTQSPVEPPERPQATQTRAGAIRLVQNQDEHGDGLGELQQLHQRPSRRRLSGFLSSTSSERVLYSSESSRANSLTTSTLPTWARLYYGSGERRWLRQAPSSESMLTDYDDSTRPPSSFQTGSPGVENLPLNIPSHSHRFQQADDWNDTPRRGSDTGSLGISPVLLHSFQLRSTIRKQPSSVWSPHLARDQRASRYSIWEPPSLTWSTEGGLLGRRNIQVVLFAAGFIFPLAWMVAAFLPLPNTGIRPMVKHSLEGGRMPDFSHPDTYIFDDARYYSARWWRNLNRGLAVLGAMVVCATVTLAVLGTSRGW